MSHNFYMNISLLLSMGQIKFSENKYTDYFMRKRKKTRVTKIMTGTGGITTEFTKAQNQKK